MTTDARIAVGLPTHPKTKKLIKRLGQAAAWNLVCLFLWAAANRRDGDLSGMTDEDIELAADWLGEEGAFVSVLLEVRFLDADGAGGYLLHDWQDHNPWAAGADMRSAKARWNAVKKHHGAAEADLQIPEYAAVRNGTNHGAVEPQPAQDQQTPSAPELCTQHATSMLVADTQHASRCAPSPSPYPSPSLVPPSGGTARARAAPPRPDDVPDAVWQDFLAIRKAKRAPLTATALTGIAREAGKVGLSLPDALAYCCEAGWQGFNATWWSDRQRASPQAQRKPGGGGARDSPWVEAERQQMAALAPGVARAAPQTVPISTATEVLDVPAITRH